MSNILMTPLVKLWLRVINSYDLYRSVTNLVNDVQMILLKGDTIYLYCADGYIKVLGYTEHFLSIPYDPLPQYFSITDEACNFLLKVSDEHPDILEKIFIKEARNHVLENNGHYEILKNGSRVEMYLCCGTHKLLRVFHGL
jgi:hypothetical protein